MAPLLVTLGSLGVALMASLVLGWSLGRAATQWFGGRGFSNFLMDVRGAMLSFLVGLLLIEALSLKSWLALGLVVGVSQAIAVARWITRRSGEWTPALVGGIALGRSTSSLVTRRAAARGAVSATFATTSVHLLTLEGVLHCITRPEAPANLGGLLANSERGLWAISGLSVTILLLGLEAAFSALLQRGRQERESSW